MFPLIRDLCDEHSKITNYQYTDITRNARLGLAEGASNSRRAETRIVVLPRNTATKELVKRKDNFGLAGELRAVAFF